MGMLQDTIKNLRELADGAKKAGTPANVGVTYKVDTVGMLVSGTFTFQLQKVNSSGSPDFGYNAVDFVATPPPVTPPSALTITPASIPANTSTNISFAYTGTTPLPASASARIYPATATPTNGAEGFATDVYATVTNNGGTLTGVYLPAGSYKIRLYDNNPPRAFVDSATAILTVA